MDRLIYTAMSGLDAAMQRQRVVANNLANASTPGFRADEFATTARALRSEGLDTRAFAGGVVRGADMAPGRVSPTGRALDVALDGDALIALQAADGSEVYSRRGDLRIGPSGVLENGDRLPVLGESGPITVPPGRTLAIAADGAIFAADPDDPQAAPERIDRIALVDPAGSTIAKGLDGHLRVVGGGALPRDLEASLTTGALEASNVDAAGTLVAMIETQRAYEGRAKLLSTMRELDQSGARLMSLQR